MNNLVWAYSAVASDEFWASTPRWRADVCRRSLGRESLVLADGGLLLLSPLALAITDHLDGTVSLRELAEDLSAAAEASLTWARETVAIAISGLVADGAVVDVHMPPTPEALTSLASEVERGPIDSMTYDPDSGQIIQVTTELTDTGEVQRTEHLPDQRIRVSTVLAPVDGQEVLPLPAGRSPAEMIPAESCVGAKLRNDEEVPLLTYDLGGGQLVSVRCHAPDVAEALRMNGADRLVEGARGPIVAFVVTPLQGRGPLRIYDEFARRWGRPRSTEEAVEVVDGLLGLHHHAMDPSGLVLLRASAFRAGQSITLLGADLTEEPREAVVLRQQHRQPVWRPIAITPDGEIVALSCLGGRVEPLGDLDSVSMRGFPKSVWGLLELFVEPGASRARREDLLGAIGRLIERATVIGS